MPILAMTVDGIVSAGAYVGACPVVLSFTWKVFSNLPVTMLYHNERSYAMSGTPDSVTFGPGDKTFTYTASFNADGLYWDRFVVDGPLSTYGQVDFSVNCL